MDEFRNIIDQYRNLVYTMAYYSLGQEEDAEDATQEVLVRLWKHWDRVRDSNVKAWLVRVTRNACIDQLRKRRTAGRTLTGEDYETAVATTPDAAPDPRKAAEAADLKERIRQALA